MAVCPLNCNSRRILRGRFSSMTNGSWASSTGREGTTISRDFLLRMFGADTSRVARRLPPAPILPCIERVWTARHAGNPPRAATFFCAISAADSLAAAGGVPGAALSETAMAVKVRTAKVLRSICAPSRENLTFRLPEYNGQVELVSLRHNKVLIRSAMPGNQGSLDDESIGVEVPNHHVHPVSALYAPSHVRESHPVRLARLG